MPSSKIILHLAAWTLHAGAMDDDSPVPGDILAEMRRIVRARHDGARRLADHLGLRLWPSNRDHYMKLARISGIAEFSPHPSFRIVV